MVDVARALVIGVLLHVFGTSAIAQTFEDEPLLIDGKVLLLKDDARRPSRRKLRLVSTDAIIIPPWGADGSASDPVLHGARLRVVGAGFDAVYEIPATSWRYADGDYGDYKGYEAFGPAPFTRLFVKPTKFVIEASGESLTHTLAVNPRPVRVELMLGAQVYCLTFGGKVAFKPGRSYRARNAPEAEDCLSPAQ